MWQKDQPTEILENLDAKILIIVGKYDNAVKPSSQNHP